MLGNPIGLFLPNGTKAMRYLYLVVMAALLCIGCGRATFDESDLWKTVNLKSKSEVKSILGRPDAVRPKNRFGEEGGA